MRAACIALVVVVLGCGGAPRSRCATPAVAPELALGGVALGQLAGDAVAVIATAHADQLAAMAAEVTALGLDVAVAMAPRFAGRVWALGDVGLDEEGPLGLVVLDVEAGSMARFARVRDRGRLEQALRAAAPKGQWSRAGEVRIFADGDDAALVRGDIAWFVTSGARSRRDRHALRLATMERDQALAVDPGFREVASRAEGTVAIFINGDHVASWLGDGLIDGAEQADAIARQAEAELTAAEQRRAGAEQVAQLAAIAQHQRRAAAQVALQARGWGGLAELLRGAGVIALGVDGGGGQWTLSGAARPGEGLGARLLLGSGGQRATVEVRSLEAARAAPLRLVTAAAPDDVAALIAIAGALVGEAPTVAPASLTGPVALALGGGLAIWAATADPSGVGVASDPALATAARDLAAAIPARRSTATVALAPLCTMSGGPDTVGDPVPRATVAGFVIPGAWLRGAANPAAAPVALPAVPDDGNDDVPRSSQDLGVRARLDQLVQATRDAEAGVAAARAGVDRAIAVGLGTLVITAEPVDAVVAIRGDWRPPGASLADAVAHAQAAATEARADLAAAIERRDAIVQQYRAGLRELTRIRAGDVAAWDRR